MAQSSMTVRMDSNIKQQFDSLCQQLGMSANTAINIFVNQVVRRKAIPFVISAATVQEDARIRALASLEQAHADAIAMTDKELSLEEINAEIREVRKTR